LGDFVLPPTYDFLKMAGEQAYICKKDGKFGLLDAKNNQIVPFIYDTIQTATNSHVVVEQAGKLSFLEIPTDVVVSKNQRLDRDEQQIPREKWYIFQTLNGKCFFMNPIPKALSIGVGYDSLLQKTGLYSNTLTSKISQNEKMYFAAFKNGKWGLVDVANTVILPFEYEQIGQVLSIHETISVKKDGKWGLVGMNGQPVTEFLASESVLVTNYPDTDSFFFQKKSDDKTPTRGWRLMPTTQIWTPFSYE
jgi:WG containing repeat